MLIELVEDDDLWQLELNLDVGCPLRRDLNGDIHELTECQI